MATRRRKLHTSSNGDIWYLCRGVEGNIFVSHEPNGPSGGKPWQIDLGTFLAKCNHGPEHQSLRQLIGELIDPSTNFRPAEEFDDHD